MRTVLVIDPDKLDGKLTDLQTSREPQIGDEVSFRWAQTQTPIKMVGVVVSVRPDASWPGHWLYDVRAVR